jgi:8-oxo-dGTP pyrophosphatase MutT (NUDIX family)
MLTPWKWLRSHKEADYGILKIRENLFEDPRNGSIHPRTEISASDWVQIIPVTREGQVVLVRQFRMGVRAMSLEFPGGLIDRGEAPQTAGTRELEEETGYRAGKVESLGAMHPNPALQTNRCHVFLAHDCQRVHDGHQEAGEDLEVVSLERKALWSHVKSGEITHALTLAAIYLWTHAERE